MGLTTIPARHGVAVLLSQGQTIKIINTHGTQVIDTWAFTLSSFPPSPTSTITTQMSMQHTRASLERTIPKVGDGLYNNQRAKVLTVTEDTTSGLHDTLIAACDPWRYIELLGTEELERVERGEGHRNCGENLVEGLSTLGIKAPQFTPSPLNLFMNIPVHEDRTTLSFEEGVGKAGEFVCLRAEVDLVVAFSACPQDILKINSGTPVDAHFEIL